MLSPQQVEQLLAAQSGLPAQASTEDARLLGLLASAGRDLLFRHMHEEHHRTGQIVFGEGDSGDVMYLIWSGRVAIVKGDLSAPTVLGFRGPGEMIGEMALLENQPRFASAVAVSDLHLLRIGREGFQHLLNSAPAVGLAIMESLSSRLRVADVARMEQVEQVSALQTENQQVLELQRVRQETSDLVVHDLRNPLGIVYGGLNLLEMVLPGEVMQANRELLDMMGSACKRMQRLVDSLLEVSRLETGNAELVLAEADLGDLVRESVRREVLLCQSREIEIAAVVPPQPLHVPLDADKIERVLANLIDNAIKYTPRGGQIEVSAEAQSEQAAVCVTDSGPGIPAVERERIFERFAQAQSNPVTRRGFGLGLTFCKLAVEAHGGRIWVEPAPGGAGSRFVFTLPLQQTAR